MTESRMRFFHMLAMAFIAVGLGLGLSLRDASAGVLPAVSAPILTPTIIAKADYWRRSWRRRGYGPTFVVPNAEVDVDVDVDAPAVIYLPPPRPLSCGEFRYWNGVRCVDARYNNPYIGPK